MKKLSEQLCEAVKNAGISRYEIARRAGLPESALWRLVHGEIITMKTADAIADVLGLGLRKTRRIRPRKD